MKELTMAEHLAELRVVLVRASLIFFSIFALSLFVAEKIFEVAMTHLKAHTSAKIIFSSVDSGFVSMILVNFYASVIILMPYFMGEMLFYIKKAMSPAKFREVLWLFALSCTLFIAGEILAYWVIFPLLLKFLLSFDFLGVDFYIESAKYLSFLLTTLLVFGLLLEAPIGLFLALKSGIVSHEMLKKSRKFVFIFCFAIGAAITPPDVVSQIAAALILYGSFEFVLALFKAPAKAS